MSHLAHAVKCHDRNGDAAIEKMAVERVAPERREGDEQFRELLAHLRQIFWIENAADDAVLYISPAYETISGRTCQSVRDDYRTFLDSIHPEDRERVTRAMAGQRENGGYEEEYRIVRPDGAIRWIWARSYGVRDGEGRILRFAGIAEDVTERKVAELDRARLAAIVEYADDAIVSMSLDGVVIGWNPGAERQYGYTDDEMLGRPISVLFPPDHYREYLQIMSKVRRGEAIPSYDTVRKRKDGTLIHIAVSIAPIETREGEPVGASKIAHDLSRVRQLEEQFRQAQRMEAMSRLAVGVAHDFNNLITVICGFSELLLDELPPGLPSRELLAEIKKAGERASFLTRQLLAFSRRQTLDLKVVDVNAVVAGSEKMLRRLAGEDVNLVTVLDPALGRVKTDAGQLEQVLMNLVANARDAMPAGGIVTIETANAAPDAVGARTGDAARADRYAMLAVRDTGTGMDAGTKARIFEPFFTTKEAGKGTGLGLAMIKGFIEQNGGHVLVESEPDRGTAFSIYLPEVEEALALTPAPAAVAPTPRGNETILLVEDDAMLRSFTRHVLQARGYTVLEAAQGDEAIGLAKRHPGAIHLLLSDVVLPGIGGKVLTDRIVALKPGIKALFMSGYSNDAAVSRGLPAVGPAFLQKPFTPDALLRKVRQSLDRGDTPCSG